MKGASEWSHIKEAFAKIKKGSTYVAVADGAVYASHPLTVTADPFPDD